MATWAKAQQDLREGCTAWREGWGEIFLEADFTEEGEISVLYKGDGTDMEVYEPSEEDTNATDWQED